MGQIFANGLFQGERAEMTGAFDLPLREQCKPALDLIQPGGGGRGEMRLEARMARKPCLDRRRLVRAVVVHHQMHRQFCRDIGIQRAQKLQEFLGPMAPMQLADHFARSDIECREQRDMPLAVAVGSGTVVLSIVVEADEPSAGPIVGFFVKDRLGQSLFGDNTFLTTRASAVALEAGQRAHARFEFDLPLLPPGDYSINVAVADGTQHENVQHEWIHDALLLRVETSSVRHSLVGIPMRRVELRRL
jgi:hypothetical protein